ncbi:MAG: hypothetical protein M1825_003929 [Sarcosagium campestre]|nr:MAG: hypothetical protein M1825_003929 [Sarcosagium campestre]
MRILLATGLLSSLYLTAASAALQYNVMVSPDLDTYYPGTRQFHLNETSCPKRPGPDLFRYDNFQQIGRALVGKVKAPSDPNPQTNATQSAECLELSTLSFPPLSYLTADTETFPLEANKSYSIGFQANGPVESVAVWANVAKDLGEPTVGIEIKSDWQRLLYAEFGGFSGNMVFALPYKAMVHLKVEFFQKGTAGKLSIWEVKNFRAVGAVAAFT